MFFYSKEEKMLVDDLRKIKDETIKDSENWDIFMFKEPWDLME